MASHELPRFLALVPEVWASKSNVEVPISWAIRSYKKYDLVAQVEAIRLEIDHHEWAVAVLVLDSKKVKKNFLPEQLPPVLIGNCVITTLIAKSAEEAIKKLQVQNQDQSNWHVTCQYQPGYVQTMEAWAHSGAKVYHPGDYHQEEILTAFHQFSGNWVYTGHATDDRLRGYQHLTYDLLKKHAPVNALNFTAWLTCCTLGVDEESEPLSDQPLAMRWYLDQHTQALLAAYGEVNTEKNQRLARRMLQCLRGRLHIPLHSLLRHAFQRPGIVGQREEATLVTHYKLLGNPFVLLSQPAIKF